MCHMKTGGLANHTHTIVRSMIYYSHIRKMRSFRPTLLLLNAQPGSEMAQLSFWGS